LGCSSGVRGHTPRHTASRIHGTGRAGRPVRLTPVTAVSARLWLVRRSYLGLQITLYDITSYIFESVYDHVHDPRSTSKGRTSDETRPTARPEAERARTHPGPERRTEGGDAHAGRGGEKVTLFAPFRGGGTPACGDLPARTPLTVKVRCCCGPRGAQECGDADRTRRSRATCGARNAEDSYSAEAAARPSRGCGIDSAILRCRRGAPRHARVSHVTTRSACASVQKPASATMMPATVKTPPTIAQRDVRKYVKLGCFSVNLTMMGEMS
jgi:hypothetical protein